MNPSRRFTDRRAAGRALAEALDAYRQQSDLLVLGLPRGGVPVAWEVAQALGAELDVLLVRKLGVPSQPELAMGAIAADRQVLNEDVIRSLGISPVEIEQVAQRERAELQRREQVFRGDRPPIRIKDRCVIAVDDGLATGATMEAALQALRAGEPRELVVAVSLAPRDTIERLARLADHSVCLQSPEPFWAVGQGYENFAQTTDEEVVKWLSS